MASVIKTQNLSQQEMRVMLSQVRDVSDILKALSHESRLMILCLLLDGEKSVSVIEDEAGIAQATVSQHLTRLRLEKLVASRREGRQIYYRIIDPKLATLIATLHDLYCS